MTWGNSELPQLVWCQVWQVTLLIIGVAVAAALARRRPHLVYLLWMLVILKSKEFGRRGGGRVRSITFEDS